MMQLLVVGRGSFEDMPWAGFHLTELDDFCQGLPEGCRVEFCHDYSDAVTSGAAFRRVIRTHDISAVEIPGCATRDAWEQSVIKAARRTRADAVVLFGGSDGYVRAAAKLAAKGHATIVALSHNEVTRMVRASRIGTRHWDETLLRALAKSSVLLTTSSSEQEQVRSLVGGKSEVFAYLRGVDLERFRPVGRPSSGPLRLLYVADRGGPFSRRCLNDAAQQFGESSNVEFTVLSSGVIIDSGGREHPVSAGGVDAHFYSEFAALVVPVECTGFSQTMMEACATGCALIAPLPYFGEYGGSLPLATYSVRQGGLAARIAELQADRGLLEQLQARSVPFARAHFDRLEWASWLRGCIEWLMSKPRRRLLPDALRLPSWTG